MTQQSNVDKLVSIDVARRFEALQEEVDLIKHEVKQTLVDLRGFIMESRTILPQGSIETRLASPPILPDDSKLETGLAQSPPVTLVPEPRPTPMRLTRQVEQVDQGFEVSDRLNTGMLGEIIDWLETVKRRGLSLHQITPYVEAYEKAGYLSPLVVKVILLSMADLDQRMEASSNNDSPHDKYFECVREFHEIVCTHPFSPGPSLTVPETEILHMAATPATAERNGKVLVTDFKAALLDTGQQPANSGHNPSSDEKPTNQVC